MPDPSFAIRHTASAAIMVSAALIVFARIGSSLTALGAKEPDKFLALPLTVILPVAALVFLLRLPPTRTSEGAVMRIATLLLILMIMALPSFALHLALGFPVAFLCVELFETRVPRQLRDALKSRVIR